MVDTLVIDPAQLLIFYPAVLALNLTPGNDMLFCLGQGIRSGPKAGFAANLGIALGALIHTLLAALGLSALLATYPLAFEVIRWAGVAYLFWLGIQALLSFELDQIEAVDNQVSVSHALRDGMIVNLFNPKVAIFILAFIPQFVDPERGDTLWQFLLYGLIFVGNGLLVNGAVGVFAGLLRAHPGFTTIFRYLSASIFIVLAVRMAMT